MYVNAQEWMNEYERRRKFRLHFYALEGCKQNTAVIRANDCIDLISRRKHLLADGFTSDWIFVNTMIYSLNWTCLIVYTKPESDYVYASLFCYIWKFNQTVAIYDDSRLGKKKGNWTFRQHLL